MDEKLPHSKWSTEGVVLSPHLTAALRGFLTPTVPANLFTKGLADGLVPITGVAQMAAAVTDATRVKFSSPVAEALSASVAEYSARWSKMTFASLNPMWDMAKSPGPLSGEINAALAQATKVGDNFKARDFSADLAQKPTIDGALTRPYEVAVPVNQTPGLLREILSVNERQAQTIDSLLDVTEGQARTIDVLREQAAASAAEDRRRVRRERIMMWVAVISMIFAVVSASFTVLVAL